MSIRNRSNYEEVNTSYEPKYSRNPRYYTVEKNVHREIYSTDKEMIKKLEELNAKNKRLEEELNERKKTRTPYSSRVSFQPVTQIESLKNEENNLIIVEILKDSNRKSDIKILELESTIRRMERQLNSSKFINYPYEYSRYNHSPSSDYEKTSDFSNNLSSKYSDPLEETRYSKYYSSKYPESRSYHSEYSDARSCSESATVNDILEALAKLERKMNSDHLYIKDMISDNTNRFISGYNCELMIIRPLLTEY